MALGPDERRHAAADKVLWCDQLSGEVGGGPGMWIDMPLAVYRHAIPAYALNRVERFYIGLMGTTNRRHINAKVGISGRLAMNHAAGINSGKGRSRPCISERDRSSF